MQEISREKAESMVALYDVLDSRKSLKNSNIVICFVLSNGQSLVVCYNYQEQCKSYFLEESNCLAQ
jgi:hypothetical protein